MSNTPRITYVLLVGAAIVYGAIFSVNKMAAAAGTPPLARDLGNRSAAACCC